MSKQLISFNNDPKLKQEILNQVREHVKNDQLIQGEGWNEEKQKGCFIGCLTHCYDHQKASVKLGIPTWLLHLADKIHEELPPEKTGEFFIGFMDALQEGMTKQHTDRILHQFLYNTLTTVIPQQYQTRNEIAKIIGMFKNALDGTKITLQAWRAAYAAAESAAAYAAAAAAYAAYAAYADTATAADTAAAAAAATAAATADTAAAYATTAYATRQSPFEKMANSLVEIIKEIKIGQTNE